MQIIKDANGLRALVLGDTIVLQQSETEDDDTWFLALYNWLRCNDSPQVRDLTIDQRISLINGEPLNVEQFR